MTEDTIITHLCENCKLKEGTLQIDPYIKEMEQIEEWKYLCNDCYELFKEEI